MGKKKKKIKETNNTQSCQGCGNSHTLRHRNSTLDIHPKEMCKHFNKFTRMVTAALFRKAKNSKPKTEWINYDILSR